MTYRVLYGDALAMSHRDHHPDENIQIERFSTEHEALNRARELVGEDESIVVAIGDTTGNLLGGVRLQLKLGYSST